MRHTKEKRRMGKLVCHHLRMMLADANGCYAKQPTPRDRDQYRLGF